MLPNPSRFARYNVPRGSSRLVKPSAAGMSLNCIRDLADKALATNNNIVRRHMALHAINNCDTQTPYVVVYS